MKLGKIYTFENASEAKNLIGKRVIASDCLAEIAGDCLDHIPNRHRCILDGIEEDFYPFCVKNGSDERFQFIREVIEEQTLMTNRQLAKWASKRLGEIKNGKTVGVCVHYDEANGNYPPDPTVRIRYWDSEDWVVPTVDIYERDCKGVLRIE